MHTTKTNEMYTRKSRGLVNKNTAKAPLSTANSMPSHFVAGLPLAFLPATHSAVTEVPLASV